MLRILKFAAIASHVALLSSCNSTPQRYVTPANGDIASLTFTNLSDAPVSLNGYRIAEDCSGGSVAFGGTTRLGPADAITIITGASTPVSFRFYRNELDGFCSTILTFTPRVDGDYAAYFDDSGSSSLCKAGLTSLTHDVEYSHRIDLVRNTTSLLVGDGRQCD